MIFNHFPLNEKPQVHQTETKNICMKQREILQFHFTKDIKYNLIIYLFI